jgi:hypothetical protein
MSIIIGCFLFSVAASSFYFHSLDFQDYFTCQISSLFISMPGIKPLESDVLSVHQKVLIFPTDYKFGTKRIHKIGLRICDTKRIGVITSLSLNAL